MRGRLVSALPVLGTLVFASPLQAQRDSSASRGAGLACAQEDSVAPAPSRGPETGAPRTAPLDTVIRLAIAERGWQRENVNAGLALGAAGTAGASAASWRACAGATVHLGSVSARLRNVFGIIHLRADPGALASIGRATGSIPPSGPPRR